MGHNDHVDEVLYARIEDLLDLGYFEKGTKEYGIALKVVDDGLSSLSPKQRVVWEKGIAPILEKPINEEEEFHAALEQDWANEALERT